MQLRPSCAAARALLRRPTLPLLCIVLLHAMPAIADDAEQLLSRAISHFDRAQLNDSLRLLDRARRFTRAPKLLAQIHLYRGLNQAVMGQTDKARAAFRSALTFDPALRLDPRFFKRELVVLLEQVRRTLTGEIRLSADGPGAVAIVDGGVPQTVPCRQLLIVGSHRVEVRGPDGTLVEAQTVMMPVAGTIEIAVHLKQTHAKQTYARPVLRVKRLEPPPHEVPIPLLKRRRIWTWVSLGGAAALGAVALGLYVSAADLKRQEMWSRENAAYSVWGVAGGLVVTSIVLFFVEGRRRPPDRRTPRTALVPMLGTVPGAALSTSF